MTAAQFVRKLIGEDKKKVEKVDSYLSKNEEWQDSVARIMMTGVLKNQFYRSADDSANEALPLIINAAKKDPAFLLKAAAFARDAHMKGMVKLGLAAIAGSANEEFLFREETRQAAVALLKTFHPGQLLQFVELCKSKVCGRGLGARPQKWVRAAMESWKPEKLEEYTLKYPTALNALVRLVHPRYTDARGGLVKYVLDDKGTAHGAKQKVVDKLKKVNTSKATIAKQMLDHEIPWDVIKGFAGMDDPDLCMAMMTQMGLSALLLNIRSLEQHNVFNSKEGLEALKLKLDEVKLGRSIPIDFAKPYTFATNTKVKGLLVDAIIDSLDVPMSAIEGRDIGVSIDISGSMNGEALQTAGLLAIPFLKAKNLWFTTFDTALYEEGQAIATRMSYNWNQGGKCPKLKGRTRRQQVEALLGLTVAGGTDVSISLREAIRRRIKLDWHVVITDEQQNAGTPLMIVWREYKNRINKDTHLLIVNAANYPWHTADFNDPRY